VLGLLGAAGVGAAAATALRLPADHPAIVTTPAVAGSPEAASVPDILPFYGTVQSGIATPQPAHLMFASIDVGDASRSDLRDLFRTWTDAASRMTRGLPASAGPVSLGKAPADTGEAEGLPAGNLTVTFGVGPSLFANRRLGLAARRPRPLVDLPRFKTDRLDPARTGGDMCIQACADDGQIAFHAVRELLHLGAGKVRVRWSQAGFLPVTQQGQSPRNLLGFKDGTNNIRVTDAAALQRFVWVGSEGPGWLRGGSYVVARRIRMRVEAWDGSSLLEQEEVFGRAKSSGAPLGAKSEHDTVPLTARRPNGKPVIPMDAHIRLAGPADNRGEHILRRAYSFADGVGTESRFDAGLFFLAYQRDPRRQFVPIQERLSRMDALNEYIEHTGSAIFAMFPGVMPGGWIGDRLF